jgi:hypothetical protein
MYLIMVACVKEVLSAFHIVLLSKKTARVIAGFFEGALCNYLFLSFNFNPQHLLRIMMSNNALHTQLKRC